MTPQSCSVEVPELKSLRKEPPKLLCSTIYEKGSVALDQSKPQLQDSPGDPIINLLLDRIELESKLKFTWSKKKIKKQFGNL